MRLEPLKRPSRDAASPSTGGAEFSPHTLGLGGEPSRYGPGADTRRGRPHQQHERLPSSACPLKRLTRCSRDERPEGSRPAVARGDLARGLNPSPSDYGTALASSLIPYPPSHRHRLAAGLPQGEGDGLTTFHGCIADGVGSACSPVARQRRQGKGETPAPGHGPFGSSLSASLAC